MEKRKQSKYFYFSLNVLLIEKALAENVSAFLLCIETRYRFMATKIIYCPGCHRKLGSCDSRTTIPKVIDCKECKKRIVCDPVSKNIEVKPIPARSTASGKTFY
jgi:hypothetical protein